MCELCLKLTIRATERRHSRRSDIFIVNFEQISHIYGVSIIDFEQINGGWVMGKYLLKINNKGTVKKLPWILLFCLYC